MENQIERFRIIFLVYSRHYKTYPPTKRETDIKLKFTTIAKAVKILTEKEYNIRTFQRDILTIEKYFKVKIKNTETREGVYAMLLDKVSEKILNTRKLILPY